VLQRLRRHWWPKANPGSSCPQARPAQRYVLRASEQFFNFWSAAELATLK
jgi:hypothetical protein